MDFVIPQKVQVFGEDIASDDLRYHHKRVLVSKEFTFDAAHHLHCYDGKCRNLHGHTYRVVFGISGFTNWQGLAVDFGDIKRIWKEKIEIHLDHRYLNETLPKMNTTAENMVVWIYQEMDKFLKLEEDFYSQELRIEFVRLYETPTAYAEARREWMERL